MTVQLAVALTTLLVENKNLVALNQGRNYFAYNLSTLYSRSTYGDGTFVVYQQHSLKLNSLTSLGISHVVHEELLTSFGLELLTVNLYDCVHFIICILTGISGRRVALCNLLYSLLGPKSGAKLRFFCKMTKFIA